MLHQAPTTERFINQPGDQLDLVATSPETQALGYSLQSVEVPDISMESPTYEHTHEALRQMDEALQENLLLEDELQWKGPKVSEDKTILTLDGNNPVTQTLYGNENVPAARYWRTKLVPSALALEALALKSDYLPTTDVYIDEATRDIFTNSADAISIRSRGALMGELIAQHSADKNPDEEQKWLSLACGAARPVLEAAQQVKENGGTPIDVTLVDLDVNVLDYSGKLADEIGSTVAHREIQSNLMRSVIASDSLVKELGEESMDVVDIMGFLEYCKDNAAVKMLRNSYRLTKPGGVLMTANMREDRPEKEIHLRGIGWPDVQMRSSDALVELAVQAGIDPSHVEAFQPTDGVYTVLRISKPLSE